MSRSSRNPFVDLEAIVNNDGSDADNEEQDLEDAFITDEADPGAAPFPITPVFYRHANENENALTELLERVLSASKPQSQRGPLQAMIAHVDAGQAFTFLPGKDDCPIFKVACRIGTEEIGVASLLNTANASHELRSAFTRGLLRGYIFLECVMNLTLIRLLEITPGVICTTTGLRYQSIKNSEQLKLLTMQNTKTDFRTGGWVRALQGIYKGDIGLVVGSHSWGSTVLFVPRIPLSSTAIVRKRKATSMRPLPRLFNLDDYPESSAHKVTQNPDGSYTLGRLSLEHGLVVKEFDNHSISSDVRQIPLALFHSFMLCGHPDVVVSSLPRPQEWFFEQDEPVIVCSSKEQGLFQAVHTDYAEVEIQGGIQRVSWNDIIKKIDVGSFVKIENGAFHGKSGWVVDIKGDVASIVDSVEHGVGDSAMNVRLNEMRLLTPPYQYALAHEHPAAVSVSRSSRHTWCGTDVTVVNHPWHKGKLAVIKDVLLGQHTVSGIKLQLQLMSYDPASPYQRLLVDLNDVVNARTSKKLSLDGSDVSDPSRLHVAFHGLATKCATPMPTSSSETPAWNPSSATPTWAPSPLPITSCQTPMPVPPQPSTSRISEPPISQPQHILLNPRLVGLSLNVIVNGGDFKNKEMEATICCLTGGVIIRYVKYNKSFLLQPEWVTPKHPSPTHDNGLLIIIKGDHCGKHARRIYHQRDATAMSIILAIVTRIEKSTDVLTGEQVILTRDFLCTVKESKKERELNNEVMKPLRAQYR